MSSDNDNDNDMVDAYLDPQGALSALASGKARRLRLARLGKAPAEQHFGRIPEAPVWLEVVGAGPAVEVDGRADEVTSVEVKTDEKAWGVHATPFVAYAAEVRVGLASGDTFSLGGTVAHEPEAARATMLPLASSLERRLGLGQEGSVENAHEGDTRRTEASLNEKEVGRFTLSFEGDFLVLRDHRSAGPRGSAARFRAIAIGCAVPALALAIVAGLSLRTYLSEPGHGIGPSLGFGAVALVLGIAAFAFFEVARYAAAYRAESSPLAWFSDDRVVVGPWVDRNGAIDTRPEGRLGAAIRTGEITAAVVREREGVWAVVLETAHGPMEVAVTEYPDVARVLEKAVWRSVQAVAAPARRKSALQRAKEKREKQAEA